MSHKGIFPLHVWDIIVNHAHILTVANISMTCTLLHQRYNKQVVDWIERPVTELFYSIAKDGDDELLRLLSDTIEEYPDLFDDILSGAAKGGHAHLVELALMYGGKRVHMAMYEAAEAGHVHIVALLCSRGFYCFNYGLNGAVAGGNLNLVYYFVFKGADTTIYHIRFAQEKGHDEIANYLQSLVRN